MQAKAFLQQECRNIKALLDSTLQHEYGIGGSEAFFAECSMRLELIDHVLDVVDESEPDELIDVGNYLIQLAELICRIERSALGAHSWPFVAELRKLALTCCSDPGQMGEPPLIHVISDGGLDGYAMNPEPARPGYKFQLILTIVLPRSARHHVLLHSILGHEVGHAMYRCSVHQQALEANVLAVIKDGIFAKPERTTKYIYSHAAAAEVRAFTKALKKKHGVTSSMLFYWAKHEAWIEEILCDLVGVVIFGPSFVAAHFELLLGLSPTGAEFGSEHPPVGWRINAVLRCAELLHIDALPPKQHPLYPKLKRFWDRVKGRRLSDPWYNVFSDIQLNTAISNIQEILDPLQTLYKRPSPELLCKLVKQLEASIPPTGFELGDDGVPRCEHVDFRHITFAGWVECQNQADSEFERINLLCEHGMMQQAAIDLSLKPRDDAVLAMEAG